MTGKIFKPIESENAVQKIHIPAKIVSAIAEGLGLNRQVFAELFGVTPSETDKWKVYGIKNRNKAEDFKSLALLYRIATKNDNVFSIEDLKDMIETVTKYPWVAKDKAASLGFPVSPIGCSGLMKLAVLTLFMKARGVDVKWKSEIEETLEAMKDELYGRS